MSFTVFSLKRLLIVFIALFLLACEKESEIDHITLPENKAEKGSGYDLVALDVEVDNQCVAFMTVNILKENFNDTLNIGRVYVADYQKDIIIALKKPYHFARQLQCNGKTYKYRVSVANKKGESKWKTFRVDPSKH